jgi:hypothetical protein
MHSENIDVPDDQKERHYDVFEEVVVIAQHLRVDCPKRRSQVLALCADGIAEPWGERYLYCVRRWVDRLT